MTTETTSTSAADLLPKQSTAANVQVAAGKVPTESPHETLTRLESWHRGVRAQFPILVDHPEMAYLDSSATSQRPISVLDAVHRYLVTSNSNAGRGSYPWANATTKMMEDACTRVRTALDDPGTHPAIVHMVSGATQGLREVALDWLLPQLRDGDEIIVPHADHSANLVPWQDAQRQAATAGVNVKLVPMPYVGETGQYDLNALRELVTERTRFVAATHVHHVFGCDLDVPGIRAAVGPEIPICLDAAQSIGHIPVSVRELDVDFVVFSGHKAMALPGSGAVWARCQRGPAFTPPGWQGSPNTSGAVSLVAALDWLDTVDVHNIHAWTEALALCLTEALTEIPGYRILGRQDNLTSATPGTKRAGLVTLQHETATAGEVGFVLATEGLMVRANSHCQGSSGANASVRASFHAYTSQAEIERLIAALRKV